MTQLTESQDDRLRQLLADRAGQAKIPDTAPPTRQSAKSSRQRSLIAPVLAAAAVLLVVFGLYSIGTASSDAPTFEPADTPAEEQDDPSSDELPDEIFRETYNGTTTRISFDEPRFTIKEIAVDVSLDPSCVLDPKPRPCLTDVFLGYSNFAFASLAVIVTLGLLGWRRSIPLGAVLAGIAITLLTGLLSLMSPVKAELAQAEPAMTTIQEHYGRDVTCFDWHNLEWNLQTPRPDLSGTMTDVTVRDEALTRGVDVYLWKFWVYPGLLIVTVLFGLAYVLAPSGRWKRGVLIAIVLGTLSVAMVFPTAGVSATAIECSDE